MSIDRADDPPVDHVAESEAPDERPGAQDLLRNVLEWVLVLVFAVVIALFVRSYLFQSFYIESGSMERTLLIDDKVVVNRLSYQWGEPQRGQIVVFRRDGTALPGQTRDLIKRVIAVGGDEIEASDGQLLVNGEPIDEPYLEPDVATGSFGPVTVPDDHVWVMGDNRNNSSDSRTFGAVSLDRIVGRAFVRYWPPSRIGTP